jgi:phosphopantetheinyl transferase
MIVTAMNSRSIIPYQRLAGSAFPWRTLSKLATRVSRTAVVDLWLVKVTEDGPLRLDAARALRGGDPSTNPTPQREEDRGRSLVARDALIQLVAEQARVDPASISIGHDELGRPVLLGGPPLHVSVSHSGDFIACAVCDRRVGVDIERTDRLEADEDFAARVCVPAEREELARTPLDSRRLALIRLWTRKEAVAKALGVGLALPFDQLDVTADRPRIAGVRMRSLWARDLHGGPAEYAIAIAGEGRRCWLRARLIAGESASVLRPPGSPVSDQRGRHW